MSPNLSRIGINAIHSIAIALPLSLVIFAYERGLTPLYGSGPTSHLLDKVVLAAAILSALRPKRISPTWNLFYAAIGLTLAPNATYWIGVWTSRGKRPMLGPAITHATTLAPIIFLSTSFLGGQEISESKGRRKTVAIVFLVSRLSQVGGTSLIALSLNRRVWSQKSIFYAVSDSQIYLTLAMILYSLWISSLSFKSVEVSSKKKSKQKSKKGPLFSEGQIKALIVSSFILLSILFSARLVSPILAHPLSKTYTHPTYPLQILSAEQSVTGLITVGEWLPPPDEGDNVQTLHSARYLRASHSILGGVWTRNKIHVLDNEPPNMDSFGTPLGDSIYSTFVLQEAVRLVNSTKKRDGGDNALVIGLGAGISTTAFMRHGISTTIVEIDPAVYKAARTFFGLPDPGPGKVFLEDARTWVSKQRFAIENGSKETLFDIIVHDCFSGGGVPQHIFTMEFWDDIKTVMEFEGILVVNFAGILKAQSSQLVINTLEKSFRHCRAFHDMFDELPQESLESEFINMVLFCTQSSSSLMFRKTRRSDWLGSPLRRHVLNSLEAREVNLELIRNGRRDGQHILTDQNNPLGALQEKQGAHHWLVMRQVLPDVHWETY